MTVTWYLVVGTCVSWIIWDVFAYWRWGNPGTESVLIDQTMRKWPAAVFLAGFLCGHLFWQVHLCTVTP